MCFNLPTLNQLLAVLRGRAALADDAELAEHLRREPPAA
jgi:hypothetical protein